MKILVMNSITFARPTRIDHVGALIYLRNTNLKYSMLHKLPVPDSNCVRFTQEAQQGNIYMY